MTTRGSAALRVLDLRTEYLTRPLGIDTPAPRLSWRLEGERQGILQAAYRLLVATSPALLAAGTGDLWDSGRVPSGRSQQVEYAGAPVASRQRCWWRVEVEDDAGVRAVSDASFWETGLLAAGEWSARWIGLPRPLDASDDHRPAPFLRREFDVRPGLVRARAYATAAGIYELHCNGERVGDARFAPGWTDYARRIRYQTYDLTDLLATGRNALGVVLGDGWYSGWLGWQEGTLNPRRGTYGDQPLALVQVVLDYADGDSEVLVGDERWRAAFGPVLASDFQKGEAYDARRELPGWAAPGYDDGAWCPAVPGQGPAGRLVAQCSPPVRVVQELPAVPVGEPLPGTTVLDLGQNIVGWVRLRVRGAAGTLVRLRFGEMLGPDGSLYTENLRGARSTDTYVLRGGGEEEVWEPSFTVHGFRYVEVTGYPGPVRAGAVTGRVATSDLPETGTFTCSEPMVNRLVSNISWGRRGNFLDVPTDCPQRDERLGWLGDAQVFARTACTLTDAAAFFTAWMDDVVDAQSADGAFPDVAPRVVNLADGAPGWGDAGVIVPWVLFERYGDTRILDRHFDAMAAWVDHVHRVNPDLVWRDGRGNDFGDWLEIVDPAPGGASTGMFSHLTPAEVLATAYFAHSARLVARAAAVTGRPEAADRYGRLADGIAAAFVAAFVDEDGRVEGDTQTGYALALRFGLLPAHLRGRAGERLAADVARRGHLTTGFLGVGQLLPALTDAGRTDLAYRLLLHDEFPSWGYSIRHGATTIWERWDGWTATGGFQDPAMNSFNHYSLGSVGEWLFEVVGGIAPDPQRPGYRHVVVHPRPGGGLTWAEAALESPYGPVRCAWRLDGDGVAVEVEIPANTTATVRLPAGEVLEIGSGRHSFTSG